MAKSETTIRMMDLTEVGNGFAGLVAAVSLQETRILIEEAGAPVAALVSVADLERLTKFEREREERFRAMEAIGRAFADVPLEELEAELHRIATEGPQLIEDEPQRQLA